MIEYLINELCADGMRHVKIVSDDAHALENFPVAGARIEHRSDEVLGLHYVEVWWACQDVVQVTDEADGRTRKFLVWKFLPGERVSDVIRFAAQWYFEHAHRKPQFAWMQHLPPGAEYGVEVDDVMLLEVSWALPGCVMIGG